VKLIWYGHSAFRVEQDDVVALIDPFLSGNPKWDGGWEDAAEGVTHVLLTHGHNDHFGDAVEIGLATGAQMVANAEIVGYLGKRGISSDRLNVGNTGGTVDCGGFAATFVNALHSSSYRDGDQTLYMGHPNGLVLRFDDGRTLYHMGDTDIFGDMALINELHAPEIGIVPIGDRFTMGGERAALACRRYFDFAKIVPCHYGTFPLIDPDAGKFTSAMGEDAVKVMVPDIGVAFEV